MTRRTCDYCYRRAIVTLLVEPGFWRTLFFNSTPRRRNVCAEHIGRVTRPAKRRHG